MHYSSNDEKDGTIALSLLEFNSKDFVVLFQDAKHNHPSFYLAKKDEYTTLMVNYIPMIAQKQEEIDKVKSILNQKLELSKSKFNLEKLQKSN